MDDSLTFELDCFIIHHGISPIYCFRVLTISEFRNIPLDYFLIRNGIINSIGITKVIPCGKQEAQIFKIKNPL